MRTRRPLRKAGMLLALVVTLCGSQGCTAVKAVGRYVQYRAQDAMEMVDVGLTITFKPCWGFYWNSLDLLVGGYCNIDGYFVGLGGNQIGITRCLAQCAGLGISQERIGWGKFDPKDDDTLYVRTGGVLGMASIGANERPGYSPACVHFFPHIGFVGVVWNARWGEMVDFILGFTTYDLCGDDGVKIGRWAWQREKKKPAPADYDAALQRIMRASDSGVRPPPGAWPTARPSRT